MVVPVRTLYNCTQLQAVGSVQHDTTREYQSHVLIGSLQACCSTTNKHVRAETLYPTHRQRSDRYKDPSQTPTDHGESPV